MNWPTGWTPCKEDPLQFSCDDCELGSALPCDLRTDLSRRAYEATRWRHHRGLITEIEQDQDIALLSEATFFLANQQLAAPVSLIFEARRSSTHTEWSDTKLEALLRSSSAFVESSPGMFKLSEAETRTAPMNPSLWGDISGAQIASLCQSMIPLPTDIQVMEFKRLAALRTIPLQLNAKDAAEQLGNTVDSLLEAVLKQEGWTLRELVSFASDSRLPIYIDDDERLSQRATLLNSIYANDLLHHGDSDWIRSEIAKLRDQLALRNVRLVEQQARKIRSLRSLEFVDIFQIGTTGLLTALDHFQPYHGTCFSTYAVWWIRQAIFRGIADTDRLIRLPVHVQETLSRIEKEREAQRRRAGQEPSLASIALQLGLQVSTVANTLAAARDPSSIEIAENAMREDSGFERTELTHTRGVLIQLLSTLDSRDALVLKMRNGFYNDVTYTLQQVGEYLGVTRERARQIESRAIKKLSSPPRSEILTDLASRSKKPSAPLSEDAYESVHTDSSEN